MNSRKLIGLMAFMLIAATNSVNAAEVVYSMSGLQSCEKVGKYNKNLRTKATKQKIEKKLVKLGNKDDATHVYIREFIDSTGQGKGMRAKAVGYRCGE